MQNKQLERQLRSIIQGLKVNEITKVVEVLQHQQSIFLHKNFTSKPQRYIESGINCTCCTLTHQKLIATGFGRNQQEALINATKNYLEMLVSQNTMIPQLKNALKMRQNDSKSKKQQPKTPVSDNTLDLEPKQILNFSEIQENSSDQEGCKCIYYQIHQHHMTQIKNLEARMKLIVKENEMLKQLLLKDKSKSVKDLDQYGDKENIHLRANYNQ